MITCLTCSDTDNNSDVTESEINETISKCGMNQEIIQKSCGDGKIEKSTLYLLMGIFRSGTENFGQKNPSCYMDHVYFWTERWLASWKSGTMLVSFFLCWLIKDVPVKQLDNDFSYLSLAQKTIRFIGEDKRQLLLIPITLFSGTSLFSDSPKFLIPIQWFGDVMIYPKIPTYRIILEF